MARSIGDVGQKSNRGEILSETASDVTLYTHLRGCAFQCIESPCSIASDAGPADETRMSFFSSVVP